MGMDIHMSIVKNGEVIKKDIFDGRNREWFENMMGDGNADVYDHLAIQYGVSPQAPTSLTEGYTKENGYFGFHFVNAGDFREWYTKYNPDMEAGWVSTYDMWRIEKQGYIPEYMDHYLDPDANPADMHFVEVTNLYDCSHWLYEYLNENSISWDADITYWFDC